MASERAKAAEAAKSHAGALEAVTPRVTSSGRPTKQAFRDAVEVIDAHARGDAAAAVEATADALASLRRDIRIRRGAPPPHHREDPRRRARPHRRSKVHRLDRCWAHPRAPRYDEIFAFDRGRRRDGSIPGEGRLGEGTPAIDAFDDEDTCSAVPRSLAGHADGVRGREEGDKRGG